MIIQRATVRDEILSFSLKPLYGTSSNLMEGVAALTKYFVAPQT